MPAVCRIGHADIPHCSGMVRSGGSSNVFVNGIGISRQTDVNTLHKKPPAPCPKHAKGITTGSLTVKVNGKGCGRIGDPITGCTFVAEGSDDVFAG
tara:strand:- start:773 stop:1060 length:288 start_codon:yes stop_codon:yes gene_type:complete